jgi:hypothetical protein
MKKYHRLNVYPASKILEDRYKKAIREYDVKGVCFRSKCSDDLLTIIPRDSCSKCLFDYKRINSISGPDIIKPCHPILFKRWCNEQIKELDLKVLNGSHSQ